MMPRISMWLSCWVVGIFWKLIDLWTRKARPPPFVPRSLRTRVKSVKLGSLSDFFSFVSWIAATFTLCSLSQLRISVVLPFMPLQFNWSTFKLYFLLDKTSGWLAGWPGGGVLGGGVVGIGLVRRGWL